MKHLTPDEIIDAAEGMLDAERQRHLAACEACRTEVESLRGLLREAAGVPVPEPSPLFWDYLSARVRQAVEGERSPAAGWFGWSTLAPAGALAAVLVAIVASLARPAAPPSVPLAPVAQASDDTAVDVPLDCESWEVVADLLGPLDWETAGAVGLSLGPGDAELAVLDLSDDERRELSRLLAGEIERSKS